MSGIFSQIIAITIKYIAAAKWQCVSKDCQGIIKSGLSVVEGSQGWSKTGIIICINIIVIHIMNTLKIHPFLIDKQQGYNTVV